MINIYKPYKIANSPSILDALKDGYISSQGKYISKVEEKIKNMIDSDGCDNIHVVMSSNGTTATHLIVLALKFKYPSIDKIYVPNNVYVAAINCVLFEYDIANLEVLPIDYNTLNIDMSCIRYLDYGACLLIVHNVGRVVDVPLIKKIRPDLIIIEDACEVFMGCYPNSNKKVGSLSIGTSFSFFANKTITSGEGGAFLTSDTDIYNYIKNISNQGQSSIRYLHTKLAYNYRMTNLQAALLYDQLELYDEIISLKKNIFKLYDNYLLPSKPNNGHNAYWMYCTNINNDNTSPQKISDYFKDNGIDIRPMFYPITEHTHLKSIKRFDPNNDDIAKRVNKDYFMFPSYPDLTENNIQHICKIIKQCRDINNTIVYYNNVSCEDINSLISNLTDDELSSFRYYNKRSISSCLEKHCNTIIVKDKNIPIGYGHLEYEDNKLWLGVVVKKSYQEKGIGKTIIQKLLDCTQDDIWLSVDSNNIRAQMLYSSLGFVKQYIKDTIYIYKYSNNIYLPVSLGEALDKHTILKIKSELITDNNKLKYVLDEYDKLSKILEKYISTNQFHYKCLYNINKEIWKNQDIFRECNTSDLAQKIIDDNDARFRIKERINELSHIKEQKGYKNKKLLLLYHMGLGDNLTMNGAVRYLSLFYDTIEIVVEPKFINTVKTVYSDDNRIVIKSRVYLNLGKDIDMVHNNNIQVTYENNGYTVLRCGLYHDKYDFSKGMECFYKQFYTDIGLNFTIFDEYAYINRNRVAENITYNEIVTVEKYAFIHDRIDAYQYSLEIYDTVTTLPIYRPNNKYNLLDYCKIIENSTEIHVIDSSFSCLAVKLDLSNVKVKIVYSRSGKTNYDDYFKGWTIKYIK